MTGACVRSFPFVIGAIGFFDRVKAFLGETTVGESVRDVRTSPVVNLPWAQVSFPTIGFQIVQSSVRKACPAITPVTMVHLFVDSTAEDLQKRRDFKSIIGGEQAHSPF